MRAATWPIWAVKAGSDRRCYPELTKGCRAGVAAWGELGAVARLGAVGVDEPSDSVGGIERITSANEDVQPEHNPSKTILSLWDLAKIWADKSRCRFAQLAHFPAIFGGANVCWTSRHCGSSAIFFVSNGPHCATLSNP